MTVPTIETRRLVLRAHELDDFEPLAAMWGDPDVARFIGGRLRRATKAGPDCCAIAATGS